jgi:hypothetical protein
MSKHGDELRSLASKLDEDFHDNKRAVWKRLAALAANGDPPPSDDPPPDDPPPDDGPKPKDPPPSEN